MHLSTLVTTATLLLGLAAAVPHPEDLSTLTFTTLRTRKSKTHRLTTPTLTDTIIRTTAPETHSLVDLTVSQCLIPGGCGSTAVETPEPPVTKPTAAPTNKLSATQCLIPGGCGTTALEGPKKSSSGYAPAPTAKLMKSRATPKGPKHSLTRTPEAGGVMGEHDDEEVWFDEDEFLEYEVEFFEDEDELPEDQDENQANVPPPEDLSTIPIATPLRTTSRAGSHIVTVETFLAPTAAPSHRITHGVNPIPPGHPVPTATDSTLCLMPPPFTCKGTETETFTPAVETTFRTVRV